MKINFLAPHLKPSGGVNAMLTFAQKLSNRGHRVIFAVESKSPYRHIKNLFTYHPFLPWNTKVKIMRLANFENLPEADIYLGDSWKVEQKLYHLNVSGKKFFSIQHDERLYHGKWSQVNEVYKLPLKKIVNATWLKELFKSEFNEDVELLFNAVDCELFHPHRVNKEAKNLRILMLHHEYEWKGTKEGVEIVQKLKQKYPDIKLILFGTRKKVIDVPHDEYYYKLYGKKLAKLFSGGDVYLCSSWDEGLCFPPRWAMASGLALVTYDNGSSRDYAFDGDTALVAKRKDKEKLSRKLEELIMNLELRRKIAQRGLEYVRKMPTWDELTDKLENIFKKALKNA